MAVRSSAQSCLFDSYPAGTWLGMWFAVLIEAHGMAWCVVNIHTEESQAHPLTAPASSALLNRQRLATSLLPGSSTFTSAQSL